MRLPHLKIYMKLVKKTRVGSKVIKRYDEAEITKLKNRLMMEASAKHLGIEFK